MPMGSLSLSTPNIIVGGTTFLVEYMRLGIEMFPGAWMHAGFAGAIAYALDQIYMSGSISEVFSMRSLKGMLFVAVGAILGGITGNVIGLSDLITTFLSAFGALIAFNWQFNESFTTLVVG